MSKKRKILRTMKHVQEWIDAVRLVSKSATHWGGSWSGNNYKFNINGNDYLEAQISPDERIVSEIVKTRGTMRYSHESEIQEFISGTFNAPLDGPDDVGGIIIRYIVEVDAVVEWFWVSVKPVIDHRLKVRSKS